MFKVICGRPLDDRAKWLRGKIGDSFSMAAEENWFTDKIVRDELRAVEDIVDVKGFCFIKRDGTTIPPQWLCQGTRQFIMMTQKNNIIYDSFYFGVNVYPFFCRWANEKNVDVTIVTSDVGVWKYKGLKGVLLNTGEKFNSSSELEDMIWKYRKTALGDMSPDGKLWAQRFNMTDNGFEYYGNPFYIDTKSKRV